MFRALNIWKWIIIMFLAQIQVYIFFRSLVDYQVCFLIHLTAVWLSSTLLIIPTLFPLRTQFIFKMFTFIFRFNLLEKLLINLLKPYILRLLIMVSDYKYSFLLVLGFIWFLKFVDDWDLHPYCLLFLVVHVSSKIRCFPFWSIVVTLSLTKEKGICIIIKQILILNLLICLLKQDKPLFLFFAFVLFFVILFFNFLSLF